MSMRNPKVHLDAAARKSSSEDEQEDNLKHRYAARGQYLLLEGTEEITQSRLPFRLTNKLTTVENIGVFFPSSKQKWTWILGWGSDNLAIVLYSSLRSGKRQIFVNGDSVLKTVVLAGEFRFETTVSDKRTPPTNPPLAMALLVTGSHADLYLDGFNVKSLRRGSMYERGSPAPVPIRESIRST